MEIIILLGRETLRGAEAAAVYYPRTLQKGQRFWHKDTLYEVETVVEKAGQITVSAREAAAD